MSEGIEVRFQEIPDEFLSLRVLGRAFPDSTSYWDTIVLRVEFTAKVSVFQGTVTRDLRVDEIEKFNNELRILYENLTGVAVLETLDKWIMIKVEALKLGHIRITGFVKDGVYDDNSLNFALATDQTFLSTPLERLRKVLDEFPVIGQR
jgi:hypothetical protein